MSLLSPAIVNHRRIKVGRTSAPHLAQVVSPRGEGLGTAWPLAEAEISENKNKRDLERIMLLLCLSPA